MNKDKVIKDLKEKMLDNNDLWYYEPFINDLEKEIEKLNKIIEDLKAILKSKGYETYIPVLEGVDKE